MLALSGYMAHLCTFRVCCSQPPLVRKQSTDVVHACVVPSMPCSNVDWSDLSIRSSVAFYLLLSFQSQLCLFSF